MSLDHLIPIGYKQQGDVCLLASYSFVLGYYKNISGKDCANVTEDVFHKYLEFIKGKISNEFSQNEQMLSFTQKVLKICEEEEQTMMGNLCTRKLYEEMLSCMLHCYCQKFAGGIRGYNHIVDFNTFLEEYKEWHPRNFKIKSCVAKIERIMDANEIVSNHLNASSDNVAMVLYPMGKGFHSIMIIKDGDGFAYRDSNDESLLQNHNPTLAEMSIREYILFSLK